MNYDALRDYIKKSEMRIVNDNFRIRMSPEIAQKYDAGEYETGVAEHTTCINELLQLNLQELIGKQPIFYTYLVPDDRLVELLNFPYKGQRGGRPVDCFDKDGFNAAYGATQNTFIMTKKPSVMRHVNNVHEYAHLIQGQLNPNKHVAFHEGFAEIVPWYILDYESQCPEHVSAVADTDVYSADELLSNVSFRDVVENYSCSFQKSYISSYVLIRTIVEKIQEKYRIGKKEALKMYLDVFANSKANKQILIMEFAKVAGLDADKLLYTTEYQQDIIKKIKSTNNIKMEPKEIER